MGWSIPFLDRIAQSNYGGAAFYFGSVSAPYLPGSGVSVVSADLPGLPPTYKGLMAGVTVPSETVEPYTWNTTHGSWSVDIVLEKGGSFFTFFQRGSLVRLFAGFPGIPVSDYAPVAFGIVEQVQALGPDKYRVSVGGLGMVLGSRLDPTGDEGALFYNLPAATTLTADFVLSTDTTMTVGSITGAERETGGNYLVQVVTSDTDGSGNTYPPFYALVSSASSGTLTLVGTAPISGALGTTAQDAFTGDTVNYLAYVAGDHPIDIALKVLTSTGGGSNGAYDTLPKSWGLGFPDYLIDLADVARARNAVTPSTWNTAAVLVHDTAESDPGTWLSTWLAGMGIWYTVRQGQLTFRAADDPTGTILQTGIDVGDFITQEGLQEHLFYAPNYPGEYTGVTYVDEGLSQSRGAAESPAQTLPALDNFTYTIPAYSNILNALIDTDNRLSNWALRIPGVMTIDTAGWYCAQLCAGDIVKLTTNRTYDLEGSFNNRNALVTGVSPAMIGGSFTTRLDLAIQPTKG